MQPGLVIATALAVDATAGEVRHAHPLAAFGRLAGRVERRLNHRRVAPRRRRVVGAAAVALLAGLPAAAAGGLAAAPYGWAVDLVVLYLALGLRSLGDHAVRVRRTLEAGDLEEARAAVGRMVSRDAGALDERRIAAAAIESVLENGSDAVFGTLFWYLVGGAPAVVGYRLVNTLDAMWGYRTERLEAFGWGAARLDDLLNWVPARLTVITYGCVAARPLAALRCARRQGRRTASPNAGAVMAAGACALGVRLGGPGVYHSRRRWRPRLGAGRAPDAAAIGAAVRLVGGGALAWTLIACLMGWWLA